MQEEKGMTEDEIVWWHYWLNGREFEQALGVGDGQGGLLCCSPGAGKESYGPELNWIDSFYSMAHAHHISSSYKSVA